MSKHTQIGKKGEIYAAEYLLKKGYSILHHNWRYGKKEIDLIVTLNEILIFVEVKTRSGLAFGAPEDAVGIKKQAAIRETASAFLNENEGYKGVRFDVLSIITDRGNIASVQHFEDAFY